MGVDSSPQSVTFGLIGVGYWGPNLLRVLMSHERVNLIAVADADPGRRGYVERVSPNVRVYEDATHLLEDSAIDAVVISTPAATHEDLATQALISGKHVLVEKPLATSVAGVDRIASYSSGLVVMAGHTFLYNTAVTRLKELIDTGDLGDVRYITSQRLNLGRVRSDVDALWNLAPHDVSIFCFLLDDLRPSEIIRTGQAYLQDDIEDVSFITLKYPTGVLAQAHVSWLDPMKVRRMSVVGSRRMVIYDDASDYKLAVYDKSVEPQAQLGTQMDYDRQTPVFVHHSGDVQLLNVRQNEPLFNEVDHFVDCILNGAKCRTGIDHARLVVEILESASSGGTNGRTGAGV